MDDAYCFTFTGKVHVGLSETVKQSQYKMPVFGQHFQASIDRHIAGEIVGARYLLLPIES